MSIMQPWNAGSHEALRVSGVVVDVSPRRSGVRREKRAGAGDDDVQSREARRSILVIDDEPDMVEMIAFGLTSLGFDVDTATDGRAGVALARKKSYDVAISDLRMPAFDGIMTLLALKECAPDVDVVIVTAYATEEIFADCKLKGAAHCMSKPFTTAELASVIRGLLDKRPRR